MVIIKAAIGESNQSRIITNNAASSSGFLPIINEGIANRSAAVVPWNSLNGPLRNPLTPVDRSALRLSFSDSLEGKCAKVQVANEPYRDKENSIIGAIDLGLRIILVPRNVESWRCFGGGRCWCWCLFMECNI